VLILSAAAGGLLALAAGLSGGVTGLALVVAAGVFAFPLYSVSVAHTNDHLDQEAMVAAAAGLMLCNGIGAALGPFAASLMMTAIGPDGFAFYLAAALGTLALFGVYRTFRRSAVPLDEQGPTMLIARATPIGTALAQAAAVERLEAEAAVGGDGQEEARPEAPSLV
jgi:MFS family permease